ncbi:hypothetical protein [Pedobacter heparinus]|uniref:hypothetical protein n=1 Tax=Pedobacter heparinus TaxID=984 RepID=UPI00292F344D|nr:hypothetical protein [Pedobacter heparinus]
MKNRRRNGIGKKAGLGDDPNENLGLDADGSSDETATYGNLNSDNNRISGNPDGEDDQNDTQERPGHSSLADK